MIDVDHEPRHASAQKEPEDAIFAFQNLHCSDSSSAVSAISSMKHCSLPDMIGVARFWIDGFNPLS